MKSRRTRKLLALLVTAAMSILMISTFVSAAGFTYAAIDGPADLKFKKVIILPQDTAVPEAGFAFEISAGTAIPATDDTFEIKPGIVTAAGKPSAGEAIFTYDEPKDATADSATNTEYNSSCTKEVAVDFTGVQFTEPGVYRYIIEEVAAEKDSSTQTPYPNTAIATDSDIIMDVYVIDDNGTLEIENITMVHSVDESTVVPKKDKSYPAAGDKTNKFVNEYPTNFLELNKIVTGSQGSKDQWFEFTIKLTPPTGKTIDSNLLIQLVDQIRKPTGNAATTYTAAQMEAQNDKDTVTWGQLSSADGYKVYLQNGTKVKLQGIPDGCSFEIVEDEKDYDVGTSTVIGTADAVTTTTHTATGNMGTYDATVTFTNTKDGLIPTGVIISAAGLLVVGVIAVIGFVFFGTRSRRRYEED